MTKWRFSAKTISAVAKVITGDRVGPAGGIAPYRSGPELVRFFNQFGFEDEYPNQGGFPSRWMYAEEKLNQLQGKPEFGKALEAALSPPELLGTTFTVEAASEFLAPFLGFDGYELRVVSGRPRLLPVDATVRSELDLHPGERVSHEFISEQVLKCDEKLQSGDYDGAITNARSLTEAVLVELETRISPTPVPYDGDLLKLFKRVQGLLNLDPGKEDLAESLKQILRGLTSVVSGIGTLRNKMGDAHRRTYKPERHHAKLAINAAKTLTDFLFDTFEYQKQAGRITDLQADEPES